MPTRMGIVLRVGFICGVTWVLKSPVRGRNRRVRLGTVQGSLNTPKTYQAWIAWPCSVPASTTIHGSSVDPNPPTTILGVDLPLREAYS